jgi:hypothetical protein
MDFAGMDLQNPSWATGRPRTSREIGDLVRSMSRMNVLWGTPRIYSELLKLGIKVSRPTLCTTSTNVAPPEYRSLFFISRA